MDQVVPWKDLCQVIEPVYPKPGNGRAPVGLERMLRIYFLQQWFNLSDPAAEEALYELLSMRGFAWAVNRCRMRPRSANFAICWNNMTWARACPRSSRATRRTHLDRHDRRRHHHQRAVLDEERVQDE